MDRTIMFRLVSLILLCIMCGQAAGFILQDLPLDRSVRNKERHHTEPTYMLFAKRHPTDEHYSRYIIDPRNTAEAMSKSY
uniref:Uncharacterized protein n=1 Tax=Plectus sambesii TaxID=2011161 RepID=A0A914VBS2_9BILA